jgi:hypothetical protein
MDRVERKKKKRERGKQTKVHDLTVPGGLLYVLSDGYGGWVSNHIFVPTAAHSNGSYASITNIKSDHAQSRTNA